MSVAMIQLPYRDIIPQADSGGDTETKVHPIVSAAKEEAANRTKTRNSVSYKSKWEEMTKERNLWRKAFKGVSIIFVGYIIIDVLYELFR